MLKKSDVKSVGLVMGGVMLAGLAMFHMRNIGLVAQMRAGYDM
ncbi:hypothetical protein AB9K35_01270 [Leisingera sp. XS_AS12]